MCVAHFKALSKHDDWKFMSSNDIAKLHICEDMMITPLCSAVSEAKILASTRNSIASETWKFKDE